MAESEKFLLEIIEKSIKKLKEKMDLIRNLPDDAKIPGFDEGKICVIHMCMKCFEFCLDLYESYCKDKLSKEDLANYIKKMDYISK